MGLKILFRFVCTCFIVLGFSVIVRAEQFPIFRSDLTTGLGLSYGNGIPQFTRRSSQYVLDWDNVYLPLKNSEYGIQGGRRVKNIFLNSGDASLWNVLDPFSSVTSITASYNLENVSGVNIAKSINDGPYFYSLNTVVPGTIFSSRVTVRSGAVSSNWVNQGRTIGENIGSESNSATLVLNGSNWIINSQTLQNFESHVGHSLRLSRYAADNITSDIDAIHVQFEDVTGFKAGKEFSSEYVESNVVPGIKWFATKKGTSRANYETIYGQEEGVITYGGELHEFSGEPLNDIKGYYSEPASTNLSTNWNTLENVGVAVLDSVSSLAGEPFVPAEAGSTSIYIDPRSGRYVHEKTDVTFNSGAPDTITSISTNFISAGFRSGMAVWVWHDTSSSSNYDIHYIDAVSVNEITLTSQNKLTDSVAGLDHDKASIIRVPGSGNEILVGMNDGDFHRAKVIADPVLPLYNATAIAQHDSLIISISEAMPADGGYLETNNNRPVYYWDILDVGVEVIEGAGSYTLAHDFNGLVESGYGFLCRNGLVIELDNRNNTSFTKYAFPGVGVVAGNTYTLSALVKANAGGNSVWERKSMSAKALFSGDYGLSLSVNPGDRIWVILNQFEEGEILTSPIITRGNASTRSETRLRYDASNLKSNNMQGSFDWTPANGPVAKKQVLWSVYTDTDNYLELSISNTMLTFRKRVSGINYEAEQSIISTAGSTYSINWDLSSDTGILVGVDGVNGVPQNNTMNFQLAESSLFEIGSMNGAYQASGSIRNFLITSIDPFPPSLSVMTPPDGTAINSGSFTANGKASDAGNGDNGISSVTVGGVAAAGGSADDNNTANWSYSGVLMEGVNNLTVIATDNSLEMNQSTLIYSLTYYPFLRDSDEDGLDDSFELAIGTDPGNPDTDGDFITDGEEIVFDGDDSFYNYRTDLDPLKSDTDGDGFSDSEELAAGTNPLDGVAILAGDLNNDSVVNVSDIVIAKQIILGLDVPTLEQDQALDLAPLVDGVPQPDGQLNVGDLLILKSKALGLVNF